MGHVLTERLALAGLTWVAYPDRDDPEAVGVVHLTDEGRLALVTGRAQTS